MDTEILELFAFVFAAIVLFKTAHVRRMDVLYGPYIQGRAGCLSVKRFWQPASLAIDRLFVLEGQKMFCFGPNTSF